MNLSPQRNPEILPPARRWRKAFFAAALASAAAMMPLLQPEGLPLPPCMFHELTGHSCLTCGLTRSLLAAARGNLSASLEYHMMGPVLLLVLFTAIVWLTTEALTGKPRSAGAGGKPLRTALIVFASVWITYGGIRLVLELA